MPKIKLTARIIRDLKPSSKPKEYTDIGRVRGEGVFGIRVNPNGTKRWFSLYSIKNKSRRFSLGKYPEMSFVEAKKQHSILIARVNKGEDPQAEKVIYRNSPTMNDLWDEYTKTRAAKTPPKTDRTIREENRKWEQDITPLIGELKVVDVTRREINHLLKKKATKASVAANRLFSFLRIVFVEALDLGWIDTHPMHYMRKPGGSENKRARYLTDDEIKTLWPFFNQLPHNARDIFKLLLLTGQRSGEVMSMKWEDIDNGVWKQSTNKTRSHHLVPLSTQVQAIINNRRLGVDYSKKQQWMLDSPFVFPSLYNIALGSKGEHSRSVAKSRDKLKKWSGITHWHSHDLRRTARTLLSRLKIDPHIRERIIGHSQGGIVDVYDMYDYLGEKADGLQKLGCEIESIVGYI